MDRVAFMEEIWTVVLFYGTQSILKTGLNRTLMREILNKRTNAMGELIKCYLIRPLMKVRQVFIEEWTPEEYNRLTVSDAVKIDEPAGGYMEMMEYRNSARVHLIALEKKVPCNVTRKKRTRARQ